MKIFICICCLFVSVCLLTGCTQWMHGSYSNATPNHAADIGQADGTITVSSYEEMRLALLGMVEVGDQEAVIYVSDMSDVMMAYYMDNCIELIKSRSAIGAYAVREITYEIGARMGSTAISVDINYEHNRAEILRIKKANTMDEVMLLLRATLESFGDNLVVQVSRYNNRDLVQYVRDYMDKYPQKCMEMPQMTVSTYPEFGSERIIEINFHYQTSRDNLRDMQQSVSDVFTSAQYYIDPQATTQEKFSQLYSFLMQRYIYKMGTSITPSYSLLRHGIGDSKAFATVFAAMCRQVDLYCEIVSGTRNGEAWHWNMVLVDDIYYYVDLLACAEENGIVFKTEEEMTGYVWDYSIF